jgi:glycosidase
MPGQLYKLDSHYGNEQQLKELLAQLKDGGIEPLADIVINHR